MQQYSETIWDRKDFTSQKNAWDFLMFKTLHVLVEMVKTVRTLVRRIKDKNFSRKITSGKRDTKSYGFHEKI